MDHEEVIDSGSASLTDATGNCIIIEEPVTPSGAFSSMGLAGCHTSDEGRERCVKQAPEQEASSQRGNVALP